MIHLFGDVPGPIIVGVIKDKLAPLCDIDSDGNFIDFDGCRGESGKIRETLAIVFAWLILCPLLSLAAALVARRKGKQQ